ncbi:MAG TPA: response regulator [Acidimicrobiales bacterium]|nr:response regulator [Acidimicrobiales bacterium]
MRSVRVLVAEDNEDHLFLTTRALEQTNHGVRLEVQGVRDGAEALDYFYRRGKYTNAPRPHLLLLDLKMPKVNGLEVLERIKADPELRSIPVVILTSSDRPEDIEESYRRGGNSFVTKPVSPTGMREGLRDITDYWMQVAALPEPPS